MTMISEDDFEEDGADHEQWETTTPDGVYDTDDTDIADPTWNSR